MVTVVRDGAQTSSRSSTQAMHTLARARDTRGRPGFSNLSPQRELLSGHGAPLRSAQAEVSHTRKEICFPSGWVPSTSFRASWEVPPVSHPCDGDSAVGERPAGRLNTQPGDNSFCSWLLTEPSVSDAHRRTASTVSPGGSGGSQGCW